MDVSYRSGESRVLRPRPVLKRSLDPLSELGTPVDPGRRELARRGGFGLFADHTAQLSHSCSSRGWSVLPRCAGGGRGGFGCLGVVGEDSQERNPSAARAAKGVADRLVDPSAMVTVEAEPFMARAAEDRGQPPEPAPGTAQTPLDLGAVSRKAVRAVLRSRGQNPWVVVLQTFGAEAVPATPPSTPRGRAPHRKSPEGNSCERTRPWLPRSSRVRLGP